MNLLMISGDRSMLTGKQGAFWYTLEEFSKHWDRIDVICPAAPGTNKKQDMRNRAFEFFGNVHFHPSPYALWRQPQWIRFRGEQLIERYKHAVMTVHEYPPFYNGIGARSLSKKTGVPYVLEVHHIVGYPVAASAAEYVGRILSRLYLPRAIASANGTRTVSRATAETLIKWGSPKEDIKVVPSFYLDRALIESAGSPAVQYDAVFCGRLVPNKGGSQVIRAIATLPRARLLVIGDGPERQKLEALARELGIMQRVEFRGWLPTQRDVLKAIKSAKVLIMNSTSEGGPRVPLEAMAAGMPVIVTRVGVMPETVIDGVNGLFTTGDPEDLAAKINTVLSDDALRVSMGQQAKVVLDRYERSKLIELYARYLRSFAKNPA